MTFLLAVIGLIPIPRAHAAPKITTVNQIVVVYSPTRDHNGNFMSLHEDLLPILEAARQKKLKVVLYDVGDTAEGESPHKKEILDRLKDVVKNNAGNSWVIIATHGSQEVTEKNGHSLKNTGLALDWHMKLSEFDSVLSDPHVKGFCLASCHAASEVMAREKVISFGESAADRVGNPHTRRIVMKALGGIMAEPRPVAAGPELEKRIAKAMEKDPDRDLMNLNHLKDQVRSPVFVPPGTDGLYDFKGDGYEMLEIEHPGSAHKTREAPVTPCSIANLLPAVRILGAIDPRVSNPKAKVLPGTYARLFDVATYPDMPPITCVGSGEGTWEIPRPGTCHGAWLDVDRCRVAPHSVMMARGGLSQRELWEEACRQFRDDFAALKSSSVRSGTVFCSTSCVELACRYAIPTQNTSDVRVPRGLIPSSSHE